MSNLADRIAQLSPEQLARLTQRLQQKPGAAHTIPIQPRDQPLPLSWAQQRLWLLHQMQPESPLLNVAAAIRLTGPLRMADLQESLQILCDRHEPLRTVFTLSPTGEPQQTILAAVDLPMPLVDLQPLTEAAQQDGVEQLAHKMACQPFDLSQGPLLRFTVLRLSPQSHILLLNIHHIIADGWSLGVLIREFALLYAASPQSRGQILPPLPLQYADYGAWQRQWLQDQRLTELWDYWQHQLRGVPQLLELPADHPRPSQPTGQGARQIIHLSPQLSQQLKALGQQANATLFMTVLAAYLILLHRYTGRTDLLVGTPVANRNRVETEGLIGALINTLALRVQLKPQETFRQLLAQVQAVVTVANEHQDLPFEKLIETLAPERSTSHAPLLQVMFSLQADPNQPFRSGDLAVEPLPLTQPNTQFDLVLDLFENTQGLHGAFIYNCDRFEPQTIQRWVGHLQTLLTAIAAQPDGVIAQLPLLTASEQRQLQQWNQTHCDYPQLCIHQVVEQQARSQPDAVALTFGGQQLTYKALDQQANQLAHALQDLGVGPEGLVGICLVRSHLLFVAILAVWKAGGAYIPLDPTYPKQRLEFMLSDAQPQVILTQHGIGESPPESIQTLYLDAGFWTELDRPTTPPFRSNGLDHLAYVIYTSGSTGKPKGVLLTHRGLANLSEAQQQVFAVDQNSQIVQFASASFDASVWEMVMAWRAGATLHLGTTTDDLLPGQPLQQFLGNHNITHATLPPTALASLNAQTLPTLQTIITAGEACSQTLVSQWLSGRQFYNAYGPTETTICATVAPVRTDQIAPSIGTPIANTQIYILDQQWQPVPIGIPGELCVSSVGLARGYLNRPGQTANRFIPNPFSDLPGDRLYRTGDLARYLDNGEIAFLGRMDHQIKVRGLRIELGEIEACLRQHPAVQAALVIAAGESQGSQLVAYCVCDVEQEIDHTELRDFLGATLPSYMLPQYCVVLETLPLLPNGKVDRKALPSVSEQPRQQAPVTPRNQTETRLVQIWQQVLQTEDIGVEDNFFELGGHSLLAVQVITQVQTEFGIALPLRRLFEAPTIARLAAILESQAPVTAAIPSIDRNGDLPLSFAQQRLWFLEQLESTGAAYHITTQLHLKGWLNSPALEQSLEQIVQRHEILRTRFVTRAGQPSVEIDPPKPLDLLVIDLQKFPPQEQTATLNQLSQQTSQTPFDLEQGPLLRVKLLQLGPEDNVALVTLHHSIADGWSTQIFLEELITLYQAYAKGADPNLPALPIQYVDFAHWQRQTVQGDVLAKQLEYWQQQLMPLPPRIDLPCDHPRPQTQTYAGDTLPFTLPTELTQKLRALIKTTGTTAFMVLLAAFKVLLYRYTGQTDLAVGSPIVNRNHAELRSLIGFFANTIVLRTHLNGNLSFLALLQQVKETALAAFTHPDLPFEKLVETLQLPRELSHTPLFQVMFAHQTAPSTLTLPGLSITPSAVPTQTAKFDLTLTINETETDFMGVLEYNTDVFEPTTIKRLANHYQTLLQGIVQQPDAGINHLPILSTPEFEQLQVWQQPQTVLPAWSSIHHWFEHQVTQTPENIALEFESQTFTYTALNTQANQLAKHLQTLGLASETRVGLLLERGPEMVIALLAVLKAGGAYVPLDPAYPLERLRYMVTDAQIDLLITNGAVVIDAKTVINLATDQDAMTQQPSDNLALSIDSAQLAYVIYTSGSTGRPKGVEITHQAVLNFLQAHAQSPGITSEDTWLAVTSLSFDIAVLELLLPLVQGAKVLLANQKTTQDGERLAQLLSQATIMQATPVTWRMLLTAGWSGQSQLKILSGGEALPSDLAGQLCQCGSELWNLYGPTETTIWSTQQRMQSGADVRIGCAIANTQTHILDTTLQPVPIGITGELYIGGMGLARGYHSQPSLTAAAFIPDPFSSTPGARLYRTGDLARYRDDGTIQHLGRIDQQVKVRGFRIELGEIESHLNQQPGITQAIVMAEAETLVAYCQGQGDRQPIRQDLQQALRAQLPDYMVPARFIWVETLPLTPNGKIDRRAVQQLGHKSVADHSEGLTPPRTATERYLAALWAEMLGLEQVGIYDNFFELGGHSLLATQVVSRIRDHFAVELPLQTLFQGPAIATLAPHIDAAPTTRTTPIVPIPRSQVLPLSYAQERLWFMNQLAPGNSAYNESAVVRLTGPLNRAALQASLNAIIERHEILRTTFPLIDGQPVQQISEKFALEIPFTDLQQRTATEQDATLQQLTLAHTQSPFDLAQGPLLRSQLLRLGPDEHIMLFTLHHIIADGWSKGVLIQDLCHIYRGLTSDHAEELPQLPIQYADFATWQRTQEFEPQLTYWRQQLGGDLPVLQLPLDAPRPTQRSDQGATTSITLSPQLSEALIQLSHQSSVTLFMTLLTGFKLLLCCHTQQRDIIVGTDVANRNQKEIEGLIGFFVNLLVLRTDLSGNPSLRELLQRTKATALAAYDHQDLPFAELVNVLQPERREGMMPLFQVLFVLQNAPMPTFELPTLTLTPTQPETGAAKFDLALFVLETTAGLRIDWNYSTDVFQADTIQRLAQQYTTLLEQMVATPDTPIETLVTQVSRTNQTPTRPKRKRFQRVKPQAVMVNPAAVVKHSPLPIGIELYEPEVAAVNLTAWAKAHRSQLEQQLYQSGALLFRGFDLPDAQAFEQVAGAICPELFGEYGDLPRTEVSGKVYGSTPYPEDRAILFHNESSHLEQWPMKIWFFCVQPAQAGGETPIVDCRQVYQQLSPNVRDRIAQKQLLYERNFVPGLDVDWRDFYQTDDRSHVEQRCQAQGVDCTWLENGGLRTRQVRGAIAKHPHTQEWVFFNQLQLHHFDYIDADTQASIRSLLGDHCLPRQVYYGDGSDIEPEVLAEINAAYDQCAQTFTWQKGDLLMLDNMLMAHGRRPFQGPRKIVVALGQMMHQSQIEQPDISSANSGRQGV